MGRQPPEGDLVIVDRRVVCRDSDCRSSIEAGTVVEQIGNEYFCADRWPCSSRRLSRDAAIRRLATTARRGEGA